jgi:hypothetical protein
VWTSLAGKQKGKAGICEGLGMEFVRSRHWRHLEGHGKRCHIGEGQGGWCGWTEMLRCSSDICKEEVDKVQPPYQTFMDRVGRKEN